MVTITRKLPMILIPASLLLLLPAVQPAPASGDDPQSAARAEAQPESGNAAAKKKLGTSKPVSFMSDVAPILVRNCIACHNPKKSESKYVMTIFTQLAKGGKQSEGMTLAPGKPDDSYFLDVLLPDAEPRMPYKLDPLPQAEIKLLERWVAEGARYDGTSPSEDWTFLLRKTQSVTVPEAYPVTVPITALAFSPDGRQVAASGYHEITFWKTSDGLLDHRVAGLCERTYAIVYSGDGKWLATASGDPGQYGLVRLWSLGEGVVKPVRELAESQDAVFAIAFSPDGKRLATAGADRIIRVHETETGKLLMQIEDHADWIFDIAFSPDGNRLASASRDKTSKVFDVVKKESLVTFTGHGQPVYTVAFNPDGKAVATGGEDNAIRVWTTDGEAKQVRQIGGFGGTVFKLRYSPDGNVLAACSSDKSVRLFNAQKGSPLRALAGHTDWVYSLAFSADSKTLASGSWDGEVRLWNVADGKLGRTLIAAPGFKAKESGARAAR
jgi:dipeptidyl aminopeptidase/acylaminoacyl peptidase